MKKQDFLKVMEFPQAWTDLEMYPPDDEFFHGQLHAYQPGDENASEYFRNPAFGWWLRRNPSKEQLKKLVKLSYDDPYQRMARDVRRQIAKAEHCDAEILQMLKRP